MITARYKVPSSNSGSIPPEKATFYRALKACIDEHPILSASIEDADTDAPIFVRPETIDLANHIECLKESGEDLGKRLKEVHNKPAPFILGVPPWKCYVFTARDSNLDSQDRSFYISFAYSHAIGDGKAGLSFHRTLLAALRDSKESTEGQDSVFTPLDKPLLPVIEHAVKFTLSRWYLLSVVLSEILPRTILNYLGISGVVPYSPKLWRGADHFFDAETFGTNVTLLMMSSSLLKGVLQSCKKKNARLTGLLHQAMVYALNSNLEHKYEFVGATPMNLRPLLPEPFTDDSIGVLASGEFELFNPPSQFFTEDLPKRLDESIWKAAQNTTERLATRAKALENQPIGLYTYIGSFKAWIQGFIGKEREGSYEITNVGVFDAGQQEDGNWGIYQIIFSQPADVIGTPFSCNVLSLKGGELALTFTWQPGAFGLEGEKDEGKFMRDVAADIKEFLEVAAVESEA